MKYPAKTSCTIVLLLTLAFSPQLFAREQYAQIDVFEMSLDELLSEEIKVDVASLFEEEELVVGSSVSSVTPDKWKRLGARRMHEALNNEMSIVSYPTMGGSPAIAIRGYTASTSSVRGIATMIDGVPLNSLSTGSAFYQLPNWELGTLRRMEIIKGPGSAIYGSDAFHGVLSMKTFESDKDHCSVEGAAAYPLYGDANVNISHGIGEKMRIDMAASGSSQGDVDMDYDNDEGSGNYKYKYDSAAGVLKLSINPSDRFRFKVGSYVSRWDSDNFQGVNFSAQDDFCDSRTRFIMEKASVFYSFANDISIEADGYYWEYDMTHKMRFTSPGSVLEQDVPEEKRYGASVTIKQPDNPLNLQWLMAFAHTKFKIDANTRLKINQPPIDEPLSFDNISRDINSVFGQAKWGLFEKRLYLLLGGRLDHYSDFGNQYTPRTGLIFLPTEKSSIKALYGKAFRAPTGSEIYGSGGAPLPNPEIGPETLECYELIYMLKEKKWKVGINGFYSLWKDGIVIENQQYVNKKENRSFGGEATLFYSLEPFAIDLGFSYVKSEELDIADPGNPTQTMDREYVAFPRYSINAGFHYMLKPCGINFFLNNRLYLKMQEGHYDRNPDPDDLPAYWRLDLNVSKVMENVEICLDVRNLLDRENHMPAIWGTKDGLEEPGTSVLLRAGYRF